MAGPIGNIDMNYL
jgi:hypothetical protein